LKEKTRHLRKHPTVAETRLWQELRRKQMRGYSFYRQRPLDQYIVDFYCPDLMLAIEVDGDSHAGQFDADLERQQCLQSLGVHFLRFSNLNVLRDMDNVLRTIEGWIETLSPFEGGQGDVSPQRFHKNLVLTPPSKGETN